jgi:hypothetical protein
MNATSTKRTNAMTTNNSCAEAVVEEPQYAGRFYMTKHRPTFLLLALFAGLVMAQPSRADSWFSAIQSDMHKIYWFSSPTTMEAWNNLEPVEGLSSRTWTTTVGWEPWASGFADDETCAPRMCLFWVGNEPWLNTPSLIHD